MPTINDVVSFTRASSGTYWDANGVLQVAPNNVWRQDHDPVTGEPRGVLIESASTNLFPRFKGDGSFANSPIFTANAIASPDGLVSATRIDMITTTPNRYELSIAPDSYPSGQVFTFQWMQKRLSYTGNGNNGAFLWLNNPVNLVNGVPQIVAELADGWELWEVKSTLTDGALGSTFRAYFGNAGIGSTTPFAFYGLDFQAGSNRKSLIPTEGSAVTRVADQLSVPLGPWWNSGSGTLLVDGVVTAPVVDSGSLDLTSSAIDSHIKKVEYIP